MSSKSKLLALTLLIAVVAYWYNSFSSQSNGPLVITSIGKVRGVISHSRNGREFVQFLGLPYAHPPVGEKRFESPEPPISWEGIREANSYGSQCLQLEMISGRLTGSEDCLFLNIFKPKSENEEKLLPVMVFIHGGAFVSGSADNYGAKYFMDENVILVTLNYRLAALGFLNTGDSSAKGNMGLKDQNMALRYLNENLKAFGGDVKRVTLFGESAGAASVHYHILSPRSKGLFSKAITQSGSALNHWGITKNPAEQAKRYAAKFNCPVTDSKEMVACLKKVDGKTFVTGHREMLLPLRDPITVFVPSVETYKDENTFLSEEPIKTLKDGTFNKVPLISGVNSEEGLLSVAALAANQTKLVQANNKWTWWSSKMLCLPENEERAQKIRKFYFGNVKNIASIDYLKNYTDMLSDRTFIWATHTHAKLYSKHAPTRLYYYTHQGDFSLANIMVASQGRFPFVVNVVLDMFTRWIKTTVFRQKVTHMGACHADEIPLLFNFILGYSIDKDNKDYELSANMIKLWTSFAIEDNSSVMKYKDVVWLPLTTDKTLKYLKLDNDPAVIDEPFSERMKFWDSLNV